MKPIARKSRETRAARELRAPRERILVVCEGEKTEPLYLIGLRNDVRAASADIQIVGKECGSSPKTIVEYAVTKARDEGDFDAVFCVFDRDCHPDYADAIARCEALGRGAARGVPKRFVAITSNPCFEFWIILHFEYTTKPFAASGRKSVGDAAVAHLKKHHIKKYKKSYGGIYAELKSRVSTAIKNAKAVNALNLENPHTKIVDLVELFESFREK